MVRIPTVGGDTNLWGGYLNDDLNVMFANRPPTFIGQLFGTGLDNRDSIPYAADFSLAAQNGLLNTVPSLSNLPEMTIGSQLTGLASGAKVRLTAGIYREDPTLSTANITITGLCDVSFRCTDNWSTSAGVTWSAGGQANTIVSDGSHVVPAMAQDAGGDTGLAGNGASGETYLYLLKNREMVYVDGVAYNRRSPGSTLIAGQWMFVNDTTDRRVVIFLVGGAGTHMIEVTTREEWMNIQAAGIHLEGIDFRQAPSGMNAQWPMNHNNRADVTWRNCMFGQTHGQALAVGGASGIQVLECVFHDCEGAVVGYNSPGIYFKKNVVYNCGGAQNTAGNWLYPVGYQGGWGSGALKMTGTDGGMYDDNRIWNSGSNGLWYDIECRYDGITNNVIFDCRFGGIIYEISKYGKIAGNVIFWTPQCRFYTETGGGYQGARGMYISTSRGLDIGNDPGAGILEGNLIMHMPEGVMIQWDHARDGVNEVQSMSTAATSATQNFTLSFNGATTANIAWNATAATVQAALEAISSVGQGGVTCTGGPSGTGGAAIVITFHGRLAYGGQSLITSNQGSPGSGPLPVISRTTAGTNDAPEGGFTDVVFHNNIIIGKAIHGVFASEQHLLFWDDSSGAGTYIPTPGANRGPYGYNNIYFHEGAREDVVNNRITWPNAFLWHSSIVEAGQDGGANWWVTFAAFAGSRWEVGGYLVSNATVRSLGTATFTNGSTAVSAGTSLNTLLRAGDYIKATAHDDGAWTQIASVTSATALVLATGYRGATLVTTAAQGVTASVQPQARMLNPGEAALYLGRYGLVKGQ